MRAARTYARRGPASAEFLAWLDAVEAECETISGHTREALRLIEHAESLLAAGSQYASPDWFTWFSPARLAAFKGNTQLKAGHLPQAKETLLAVLNDPSIAGNRGHSVILADLAAVEAAQHNPEAACAYAIQALDQLGRAWYATGMDRVLEVRKTLQPDAGLDCGRPSMTGSTTGRPRSARSSVKRGDLAGQLGQRVNPQRRHLTRGRVIPPDHRPRTTVDQRRPQPQPRRWHNIVIQPVTHIQGLIRANRRYLDHLPEEPRIGLGDPPVIRSRDQVGRQAEPAQDVTRAGRLISSNADPQALGPQPGQRSPHVRI
jgi:hypothetical protein